MDEATKNTTNASVILLWVHYSILGSLFYSNTYSTIVSFTHSRLVLIFRILLRFTIQFDNQNIDNSFHDIFRLNISIFTTIFLYKIDCNISFLIYYLQQLINLAEKNCNYRSAEMRFHCGRAIDQKVDPTQQFVP